ncbi:MAG: hypothetical protein COV29_00595 [Candidatus Yanofskybacteria bacterium CG10_big_fil_rev_8_21_14_0_10_36_16]|uniref:Uncharacterized protein n=1 Tax=Candidatus Yanofskybacteria bacterium CG10_big_fil_rev_8_21_14_0_10_36_16 TaxID=1975096 RepID=A0A2J0Q8C7_9BACT|nr:MAG: hypothetical protein COV29_00595 [Candidatus Yanofskybacteria bacterium CG10_big_fil_rev_8_21_14_0_10_36_16]
MYLIAPLIIFAVSLTAILFIVGRKFSYLKKLNPEIIESGAGDAPSSFFGELFPELLQSVGKVDFTEHKKAYFSFSEKILRRLRIISLKIDRFIHDLITKIKSASINHKRRTEKLEAQNGNFDLIEEKPIIVLSKEEKLRQREQELIMEIARNPKNPNFYRELGLVYFKLKNWSDAVESFKAMLKLSPGDSEIEKKMKEAEGKLT